MNDTTKDPVLVVSGVLQASKDMLTVSQLMMRTDLERDAITVALRTLHRQGQIESIPGRSPATNRYGWLQSKPNPVDQALGAIALDSEPAGVSAKAMNTAQRDDIASSLRASGLPSLANVTASSDLAMAVAHLAMTYRESQQGAEAPAAPVAPAYLIRATKRRPRVMRDADKAQAAALAAARAGARRAEVFALVPVGAALPTVQWTNA